MNNEIALRTSKGEYLPGETVFGAVYLNVCRPTEASGIKVTFKGLETCVYEYECGGKCILKNETAHVDYSDVVLYSQKDFFEFGAYVFPFKFDLPREIPGTHDCTGENKDSSWKVGVTYSIRAHAVGAAAIKCSQKVVVYQAGEKEMKDNLLGTAEDVTCSFARMSFGSKKIHITAKILQNYTETGSNMQLRLVVTNPTKVKVQAFKVLLLRYFTLSMRDGETGKKVLGNMEYTDDVCHVAPEMGPHEVQKVSGAGQSLLVGNSGLDRLQIPLREKSSEDGCQIDVPPTVKGKHVKNQYHVEVTLNFDNGQRQSVTLPVAGILPKKNEEWLQWTAPSWAFSAEVKLSSSLFSVPQTKLRTEAFSGLPTFQVL